VTQNPGVVTRLTGLGVQAKLSSSEFTYTHQKTLVADGRVAFIFTGNFDFSSFDKGRNYAAVDTAWQDIDDLETLFEADWAGVAPSLTCTRLVVSPVNSRGRILDVIAGAKKRLDVEALYVTDPDVLQAILDAHKRGVAVRVIINDPSFGFGTADQGKQLVAAGVAARRSGTEFVHAKVLLTDGTSVYLGSENFSKNSLLYNREVGAVFAEAEIDAKRIAAAFESDWAKGISF
jgi:phosphatidylserine/phosphatidylglycerophosphate/cardiolipin synthase-like enzyme